MALERWARRGLAKHKPQTSSAHAQGVRSGERAKEEDGRFMEHGSTGGLRPGSGGVGRTGVLRLSILIVLGGFAAAVLQGPAGQTDLPGRG